MRPRVRFLRWLVAYTFAALALLIPAQSLGLPAKTIPFEFKDIDGQSVRLTDYRGQWLLVSFWAPWCPLCKVQMPALRDLDSRPDFTVIGIGLDYDKPASLRTSIRNFGMPFRNIAGGARRDPNSPHRQVGPVDFFPTSYLYDPNGELAMYIPGQLRTKKVLAFMDNWRYTATGTQVARAGKTDKLAAFLQRHHGKAGEAAYADWRQMIDRAATLSMPNKLVQVNDFFNRRLRLSSDQRIWGRTDYWATLGEVLGKGMGDAEDFALAKYFSLLALDVAPEKLRLVYVSSRGDNDPVHMVLAYFDSPKQEPALLDVRVAEVLPASQRSELKPVYSFNGTGAWGDANGLAALADSQPTLWEDTLRRARDEGFD